MLNIVRLASLIKEERIAMEAKEHLTQLYNEAMALKICPSCGSKNTLSPPDGPCSRMTTCTSCNMVAEWHSTRAMYTEFKESY